MFKKKREVLIWILPIVFSLVSFFVFSHYPQLTECIYSRGIYLIVARLLSGFSALFFFSLFELLLVFSVLYVLFLLIYKCIIKKEFIAAGKQALKFIVVLLLCFYWFWGFNYYRQNIFSRQVLVKSEISENDLQLTCEKLVLFLNENYIDSIYLDRDEIDEKIEHSYKRNAEFLKLNYPNGNRRVKYFGFKNLSSKIGVLGMYGPFFSETHLNRHLLSMQYPLVLAHEKSHQFGITSEAEANFYAYVVCKLSGNSQLEYAAELRAFQYLMADLKEYDRKAYSEIYSSLKPEIIEDIMRTRMYWQNLRNEKMVKTQSKVYNMYLKTNGISSGIKNYDEVTEYLLIWLKPNKIE